MKSRSKAIRAPSFPVFVLIALALVGVIIVVAWLSQGQPQPKHLSVLERQEIAEDFIKDSATFRYDAINYTLVFVIGQSLTPGNQTIMQYIYSFQCRHAGYGDRTGQALAQVLTPHMAEVVVDPEGNIRSAILDGKWDMIQEKRLTQSVGTAEDWLDWNWWMAWWKQTASAGP